MRTFTIAADEAAPVVTLTEPAAGALVSDTTPRIAGSAGRLPGDDGVVTVKLFNGTLASGLPAQTLFVPRDAGTGAWAVDAAALADGPYTVHAQQTDTAGHVGVSNSATFGVKAPVARPRRRRRACSMAPAEEDLRAALAGKLTVLVSCATGCSAKAGLSVSARTARRLGVGSAPVRLGSGSAALAREGTAHLRLRLSRAARCRAALPAGGGREAARRGHRGGQVDGGEPRAQPASRAAGCAAPCGAACRHHGLLGIVLARRQRIGLAPRGAQARPVRRRLRQGRDRNGHVELRTEGRPGPSSAYGAALAARCCARVAPACWSDCWRGPPPAPSARPASPSR